MWQALSRPRCWGTLGLLGSCVLASCLSVAPEWRPPGSPTAEEDDANRKAATRAWAGDPADAQQCRAYAEALRATSHDDEAHALVTAALKCAPQCADFYELRGDIADELGFHRSAAGDYENALRLQPARAVLCRKLGEMRLVLQQNHDARSALLRGIELAPEAPRLHELLAIALARSGEHLQAARTFARALELRERAAAAAPASAADVAQALAWCERAELDEPGCAEASYLRGRLLEAQGCGSDAVLAYALALSKEPGYAGAVDGLVRLRAVAR